MALPALYQGFRVWEYTDRVLFEPLDREAESLAIARSTAEIKREGPPSLSGVTGTPFTACGLLGQLDLLSGPYLLLITDRLLVGSFQGAHVFKVTATKIVQLAAGEAAASKLTAQQKKDEAEYLKRVRSALSAHGLFFSYSADISTNLQKSATKSPEDLSQPLLRQAQQQFVWNRHLLLPLEKIPEAAPFLLPVVQGSFNTIHSLISGSPVQISLIARRSTDRIGTRMWRRGANASGSVANFVESEQILEAGGRQAALVQLRGSIPLYWEQIVDLTYKPKMKTVDKTADPFLLHVKSITASYGKVLAVDLVNQKGGELRIGSAYAAAAMDLTGEDAEKFKYVAFDFHAKCGHTHFDRLSILFDKVSADFQSFKYFLRGEGGQVEQEQTGVVRTNCVDCLDRTNVTQSLFARKSLEEQLRRFGLLEAAETVADHADVDREYKIMWADHGDDISKQYSGTGALKGDFVRFGKRSKQGIAQDGVNSLLRYIFNNFSDGLRQDGLDLITGHFEIRGDAPSPFEAHGVEKYLNFPAAFAIFTFGLFSALSSLLNVGNGWKNFFFFLLWGSVCGALAFTFKKFGKEYCDRPRLCKLR